MKLLYATFPSIVEAKKISRQLLSKRLIACANVIESESLYRWKGKILGGKEFIAIMKTTRKKSAAAGKAILELHPFETPCVLEIPCRPNGGYAKWAKKQLE